MDCYELLAETIASYMLSDSLTEFPTITGVYVSSMGVVFCLAHYVRNNLIACFIQIKILVGLIGGILSLVLFLSFSERDAFRVGLEIPFLLRSLELPPRIAEPSHRPPASSNNLLG